MVLLASVKSLTTTKPERFTLCAALADKSTIAGINGEIDTGRKWTLSRQGDRHIQDVLNGSPIKLLTERLQKGDQTHFGSRMKAWEQSVQLLTPTVLPASTAGVQLSGSVAPDASCCNS